MNLKVMIVDGVLGRRFVAEHGWMAEYVCLFEGRSGAGRRQFIRQ